MADMITPETFKVQRLQFHVKLLASALGNDRYHVVRWIVEHDMDHDTWDELDKILDRYDREVEAGNVVNQSSFEIEMGNAAAERGYVLSRNDIESLVSASFDDGRFSFLARHIADTFGSAAMKYILSK